MQNSDILQKLIETKPILRVGGAFDSMSAKLVEINGFDAIWTGSFAISATHALPVECQSQYLIYHQCFYILCFHQSDSYRKKFIQMGFLLSFLVNIF